MRNNAIYQIMDSLEKLGLRREESLELTLQLLAWEKLSKKNTVDINLTFSEKYIQNPEEISNIFQALSASGGVMFDAFSQTRNLMRISSYEMMKIINSVNQLSITGVLDNIDVKNIAGIKSNFFTMSSFMNMPEEIADLLVTLGQLNEADSVYVPWDSGLGQLASRAITNSSEVYYESNFKTSIPALISLLCDKTFEVKYSDPILKPTAIVGGRPRLFDITVAFPPFGMKYSLEEIKRDLFNRFPEQTQIGSVLAIRHALSQTKSKLVIAIQNSVLFSHGIEKDLRRDLVDKGMIEAVIAMPSGLLFQTNISFTILVLIPNGGARSIKFINAHSQEFYAEVTRTRNELKNIDGLLDLVKSNKNSTNCSIVSTIDILENDVQLQVDRYVVSDSRRHLEKQLSGLNRIRLHDIVRTVRAIPIGDKEEKLIAAIEIGAIDLPQFGYIEPKGKIISVNMSLAKRYEDCFLRPLDIILIVKGSVGRIGIVPLDVPVPGNGGWVAGQSAIVLRAHPEYCAQSLFVQLRSSMGQALLSGIVSGATIKLIQLRELMNLEIVKSTIGQDTKSMEIIDSEDRLEKQIQSIKKEQELLSKNIWNL